MNKYVKCIVKTSNQKFITINKIYKIISDGDHFYEIYDDNKVEFYYLKRYFTSLNNLEKILYT